MIPLATTTISVLRLPDEDPDDPRDPYDAQPERDTASSGVRARIGQPSGSEQLAGGSQEIIDAVLWSEPVDLTNDDQVLDGGTGTVYDVAAVFQQNGLGLEHTKAWLRHVKGVS